MQVIGKIAQITIQMEIYIDIYKKTQILPVTLEEASQLYFALSNQQQQQKVTVFIRSLYSFFGWATR